MIQFMSADLEKLASFYGTLQQKDIAKVLEGVAEIARGRKLPEDYLNLEKREPMSTEPPLPSIENEKKPIDEDAYTRMQKWILGVFSEVSPGTDVYANDFINMLDVMRNFNQRLGKNLPDDTEIKYLLIPNERTNRDLDRVDFRKDPLRSLVLQVDQRVRVAYTRGIEAIYSNGIDSLGKVRALSSYQVKKVDRLGIVSLNILQTAFYSGRNWQSDFDHRIKYINKDDYVWYPIPPARRKMR